MSRNGADGDEMAFLNRPTPEDAALAGFADSLRATLVAAPPVSQAASIVPRLAEEARVTQAQRPPAAGRAEPRSGSRMKTVGQLALGFCLVPLAAAGLATAGVKLPEPAQEAFESVGIDLPNQKEKATEPTPSSPAPSSPDNVPGAAPESTPETENPVRGRGKAKDKAKDKDKAKAKDKAKGKNKAKRKGQAQAPAAQAPDQSGSNGNGNGNGNANGGGKAKSKGGSGSPGNSGNAPGHNKTGGSSKGNGNGNAVGKTGSTPPGQAKKPASPGNSADAPGKAK